jgi:hypothetical protein
MYVYSFVVPAGRSKVGLPRQQSSFVLFVVGVLPRQQSSFVLFVVGVTTGARNPESDANRICPLDSECFDFRFGRCHSSISPFPRGASFAHPR